MSSTELGHQMPAQTTAPGSTTEWSFAYDQTAKMRGWDCEGQDLFAKGKISL